MKLASLIGLALLALCAATPPAGAGHLSAKAKRGRTAMKDAQCNRCHTITDASGAGRGLEAAPRKQHCVGCHTWILATKDDAAAIEHYRELYPDWDRYLKNVVHYTKLPDLGTLTRRVRPSFVRSFLDAPFDLRPHLDESMIPVRLTDAQKDDVVAYLSELNDTTDEDDDAPRPTAAHIAQGRDLFEKSGCASCHLVGNIRFRRDYDEAYYASMKPTALLAPNLRHARERLTRAMMVRWIADPQAVIPGTTMPKPEITPEAIERIADFLLYGDLDAQVEKPKAPLTLDDVPTLDRKVGYDEVNAKVFGKICIHCHMNADNNGGDGGPGNTGGLGWQGARLDLETYDGIRAGLVRDGKRVSVLDAPSAGEAPLLLASLMRRHEEAARDYRPVYRDNSSEIRPSTDRPAMPLGLPPLPVDQLSLIKTWIAQGAPGPTH